MKKTCAILIVGALAGLTANATLVINDPGFEGGSFTDVGDPFSEADSANFDKWVFKDDTAVFQPREWSMPSTGGNTGGYADGTFGNSTSYRRTIFQAVTDNKANTGLMDLVFDLNLDDNDNKGPLNVGIWGVVTLSGASFSFDTAPGPTFGADVGDAISLASQSFSTDTSGWEQQTISNIDLGTGYDLIIIGFQSNNYSDNSTVGIDNVAMIPEPATMGLLSAAGLGLLWVRRRRMSL